MLQIRNNDFFYFGYIDIKWVFVFVEGVVRGDDVVFVFIFFYYSGISVVDSQKDGFVSSDCNIMNGVVIYEFFMIIFRF